MKNFIDKKFNYAVVGASSDEEKYGYRALKDLLTGGYKVFPVNLKGGEILEQKVYKNLSAIKDRVDVVIFLVPPIVTLEVLAEVKSLGIKKVWFQPGSESDEAENFCKNNNIEYISKACIMIEREMI